MKEKAKSQIKKIKLRFTQHRANDVAFFLFLFLTLDPDHRPPTSSPPPPPPTHTKQNKPPPNKTKRRDGLASRPTAGGGGASTSYGGGGGGGDSVSVSIAGNAFDLDSEVADLRSSVGLLKQMGHAIGQEVAAQSEISEKLQEALETARLLLRRGGKRLERAMRRGKSFYMLYLVAFCFALAGLLAVLAKLRGLARWVAMPSGRR